MKKFLLFAITATIILTFSFCGKKSVLEKVAGRWVLQLPEDTQMGVDIEEDGTGHIRLVGGDGHGHYDIILSEDVTYEVIDNDIYVHMEHLYNGGHMYVKDDQLFSDNHQPFERID